MQQAPRTDTDGNPIHMISESVALAKMRTAYTMLEFYARNDVLPPKDVMTAACSLDWECTPSKVIPATAAPGEQA